MDLAIGGSERLGVRMLPTIHTVSAFLPFTRLVVRGIQDRSLIYASVCVLRPAIRTAIACRASLRRGDSFLGCQLDRAARSSRGCGMKPLIRRASPSGFA